ncbi:hypothetical protein N431DRAFT_354148 [Stipitochalara longipes BDJ]|nr:hypothetical protein N431DRAFT_354148 [Stipitochalara longipes BDJ]
MFELAGPYCARNVNHTHPLTQTPIYTKLREIPQKTTQSLPSVSILKSPSAAVNRKAKSKEKLTDDLINPISKTFLFEELFFGLPSDLQVNVVAYLCIPDLLNLRQVSKNWLEFITINEAPISRSFLRHNRVPGFAVNLYPLPAPKELELNYISGLWHRLSVTSKLSTLLSDWITTDIFLRKNGTQQLDFLPQRARIRRRLIPILFTIAHFFETYRHLHLQYVLDNDHPLLPENYIINPIERHIMNMYNNETLLQAHQVFPFLLSYLSRKLRPPSYLGRLERSLHGYVRSPVPAPVLVGIFCIGGMEEVTRISGIESYDSRRVAVDDWHSAVFQQPIENTQEAHRWPLGLGQKKSKQLPSNTVANSFLNRTCNVNPSTDNGKQKATTNSLSMTSRQPLSAEHARALQKDLPALTQIWIPTAEALLLARQAVERWQDIKRNGQAMHELILDGFTAADELFYGCNGENFDQDTMKHGWGDLLDGDG